MTAQFVVLLTDEKDVARGEIKLLATAADVAHHIEVLLEGGSAQENIRVFHGTEIELAVSYRPVVSLSAAADEPSVDEPSVSVPEPAPDAGWVDGDVPEGDETDEAQGVRNGVRFSELFRPS